MGKGSFKYTKVGNIWRLSMNNIHWHLPAYLWTYQMLLAITDAPGSRGFIKTHNNRDVSDWLCCWLLLQVLMSLQIVSQRTSTTMCMFTQWVSNTWFLFGGKKKLFHYSQKTLKKSLSTLGKLVLPQIQFCANFDWNYDKYVGVKCGYTLFPLTFFSSLETELCWS